MLHLIDYVRRLRCNVVKSRDVNSGLFLMFFGKVHSVVCCAWGTCVGL
jgi:hypothetical protein